MELFEETIDVTHLELILIAVGKIHLNFYIQLFTTLRWWQNRWVLKHKLLYFVICMVIVEKGMSSCMDVSLLKAIFYSIEIIIWSNWFPTCSVRKINFSSLMIVNSLMNVRKSLQQDWLCLENSQSLTVTL